MFWIRFTGSVWVVFFLLVLVYENILLPSGLVQTRLGLGDPIAGLGAVWIAILAIPGVLLVWLGRVGNPTLQRFLENLVNDLESTGRNIERSAAERDRDFADPFAGNSADASARLDRNVRRSTATRDRDTWDRLLETRPPLDMKVIEDKDGRFSVEVPANWDVIASIPEDDFFHASNNDGLGLVTVDTDNFANVDEDVTMLTGYADFLAAQHPDGDEDVDRKTVITPQGLTAMRIETRKDHSGMFWSGSFQLVYLSNDLMGIWIDYSFTGNEGKIRPLAEYSFSTFRDNLASNVPQDPPPLTMKVIEDKDGRFSIEVPANWYEPFSFAEYDYVMLDNPGDFGMVVIDKHDFGDLEEDVTTLAEYADYCASEMFEGEEEISREPILTSQGLTALRIETVGAS